MSRASPVVRALSIFVLVAVILLILLNIFQRDVGPSGSNVAVLVPYSIAIVSFVLAVGSGVTAVALAGRQPGFGIAFTAASLLLAVSGTREFMYSWEASVATDVYGLVVRSHKFAEDVCFEAGWIHFTIQDKGSWFRVFRGVPPFSIRDEDLIWKLMLEKCP